MQYVEEKRDNELAVLSKELPYKKQQQALQELKAFVGKFQYFINDCIKQSQGSGLMELIQGYEKLTASGKDFLNK